MTQYGVIVYEMNPVRGVVRTMKRVVGEVCGNGRARRPSDIKHEATATRRSPENDLIMQCGHNIIAHKKAGEKKWRSGPRKQPADEPADSSAPARAAPTGPVNVGGGASFTF